MNCQEITVMLPKMLEKVSTSNDCITAIHLSKKVPLVLLKPSMVQYIISGAKDIWPHGEDTPAELHKKTMIGVHQTQFFDLSKSELLHYAKEFA